MGEEVACQRSLQEEALRRGLTVGDAGFVVLAQLMPLRTAARVRPRPRVAEVLTPIRPQRVTFIFS